MGQKAEHILTLAYIKDITQDTVLYCGFNWPHPFIIGIQILLTAKM